MRSQPSQLVQYIAHSPSMQAKPTGLRFSSCLRPLLFVFLSVGTAVWILTDPRADPYQHLPHNYVLQGSILIWSSWSLSGAIMTHQVKWARYFFWLFVYVFLGLAGFTQLVFNREPMHFNHPEGIRTKAYLIILVGLACYELGYTIRPRYAAMSRSRTVVTKRVAIMVFIAVLLSPYFIQQFGGVGALFTSREAVSTAFGAHGLNTDSSKVLYGIIQGLGTILPLVGLIASLHMYRLRKSPFVGFSGLAIIFAIGLVNIALNSPISNPRQWAGIVLAACLLSHPRLAEGSLHKTISLALTLLFIFGFPYSDYFRHTGHRGLFSGGPKSAFLEKADYDVLPQLLNTVALQEEKGYTQGHQLASEFLFFVPRSLWPQKSIDTGSLVALHTGFSNRNLSEPLWGEAYLDFGILGVVACFLLLGLASQRGDTAFRRSQPPNGDSHWWTILAWPMLATFQLILLRGSLLQAMGRFFLLVAIPILLTTRSPDPGTTKSSPPHRVRQ